MKILELVGFFWLVPMKKEEYMILDIYENVFNHKVYTGRSGNMFAYEGIGSVYWHMVSKLLLAVQEIFFKSGNDWICNCSVSI